MSSTTILTQLDTLLDTTQNDQNRDLVEKKINYYAHSSVKNVSGAQKKNLKTDLSLQTVKSHEITYVSVHCDKVIIKYNLH